MSFSLLLLCCAEIWSCKLWDISYGDPLIVLRQVELGEPVQLELGFPVLPMGEAGLWGMLL